MSNEMVKEGELVEIRMVVRVPKAATAEEVEDWLRFELGANGRLSSKNPLISCQPEVWGAFGGFSVDYRGTIGIRECCSR